MRRQIVASLLVFACVLSVAQAGALRVTPLEVQLATGAKDSAVTVSNLTNSAITVQARIQSWQQTASEDVLEPSDDWIFTPPIFKLEPHASQTLRMRFRGARDRQKQKAYRLYLDSLPADRRSDSSGVGFRFRVGLPLFVQPIERGERQLKLSAQRQPGLGHQLTAVNSGQYALRMLGVEIYPANASPDDAAMASHSPQGSRLAWLLPGSEMTFSLAESLSRDVAVKLISKRGVDAVEGADLLPDGQVWMPTLP